MSSHFITHLILYKIFKQGGGGGRRGGGVKSTKVFGEISAFEDSS